MMDRCNRPDYLGERTGTIVNLLMLFILSWSGFILVFNGRLEIDVPKYAFDHIWYAMGLAAAIFLVSDASQRTAMESRQEEEKIITQGTALLAAQTHSAMTLCRFSPEVLSRLLSNPQEFCKWINALNGHTWFVANTNWVSRDNSSPPTIGDLLSVAKDQGVSTNDALRLLREYNSKGCNQSQTASLCNQIPDSINYLLSDLSIPYRTEYALAIEPVVPAIINSWKLSAKNSKRLDDTGPLFTFRWFFFLLFAVLAGGKVSFATQSLCKKISPTPFAKDFPKLAMHLKNCAQYFRNLVTNRDKPQ